MKIQQFCGEGKPRGGGQEQRGNGRPYREGEEASVQQEQCSRIKNESQQDIQDRKNLSVQKQV